MTYKHFKIDTTIPSEVQKKRYMGEYRIMFLLKISVLQKQFDQKLLSFFGGYLAILAKYFWLQKFLCISEKCKINFIK